MGLTDLERFFRQIVRNLAATDPARLHRPLPLTDVRESIVPYRANRRALQLESSEDYELVLMRLCAGEGGFARTEPDELRDRFAAEVRSSNPDLDLVQRHENAVLSLEPKALALALNPQQGLAFAPPGGVAREAVVERPAAPPELPQLESDGSVESPPARDRLAAQCVLCGRRLPTGRAVNFCPHCGGSQLLARCPGCQSETEPGWRHCVSCGFLIGGG
jgi:hypothetical protein